MKKTCELVDYFIDRPHCNIATLKNLTKSQYLLETSISKNRANPNRIYYHLDNANSESKKKLRTQFHGSALQQFTSPHAARLRQKKTHRADTWRATASW